MKRRYKGRYNANHPFMTRLSSNVLVRSSQIPSFYHLSATNTTTLLTAYNSSFPSCFMYFIVSLFTSRFLRVTSIPHRHVPIDRAEAHAHQILAHVVVHFARQHVRPETFHVHLAIDHAVRKRRVHVRRTVSHAVRIPTNTARVLSSPFDCPPSAAPPPPSAFACPGYSHLCLRSHLQRQQP